jgi:hypothetical protein
MNRHLRYSAICAIIALCLAACGGKGGSGGSASGSPSSSAAPMHTALPAGTKTPVTFTFSDVAVASSGAHTLRLGFSIVNGSKDPQLCDYSEFAVQLDDGTVVPADGSAENSCDPDTVDPNSSGKATMYFVLPRAYTGNVTLMMVTNDVVVGQGTTTLK